MTGRVVTSDAAIDRAIARAQDAIRPRAVDASYRADNDTVVIRLEVVIPRARLQGLENATPEQLARIGIEGPGTGLHWPALGVDHHVPGLLAGIFGTRQWMRTIGRKGGAVRSLAKARAARANGRLGGRPHIRFPGAQRPSTLVAAARRRAPARTVLRAAKRAKARRRR